MSSQLTKEDQIKFLQDTEKFDADCYNTKEQQFNYVLLLYGCTGSGKTTTYNAINQPKSLFTVAEKIGNKTEIIVDTSSQAKIGTTSKSQTVRPNIAEIRSQKGKKLFLIDPPGLFDSEGLGPQLFHATLIVKIFRCTKNIRFVLVIDQKQITNKKIFSIKLQFKGFLDSFKEACPNIDKIILATSLVVTKSEYQNADSIRQIFKKMYEQNKSKKTNEIKLIKHFSELKQIYVIPKPKAQGNLDQDFLNAAKLIVDNEAKQQFYKINQQLDVGFNFTQKQVNIFYERIRQNLFDICKIVKQAFVQIVQNKTTPNNVQSNFEEQVRKFIECKQIDVYQEKVQNRKSILIHKQISFQSLKEQFQIFDHESTSTFSKIQLTKVSLKQEQKDFTPMFFLWNMINADEIFRNKIQGNIDKNSKNSDIFVGIKRKLGKLFGQVFGRQQQQPSLIKEVSLMLNAYLNNIINYSKPLKKSCLYNFCYIVSRNLQALQSLETLKSDIPKKYGDIVDMLQINQTDLIQKQKQFLCFYTVQKNQPQSYLKIAEEVIQYIHERCKKANQIMNPPKQEAEPGVLRVQYKYHSWEDFEFKRKNLQIQIERNRGNNWKELNVSKAIESYESCRKQIEKLNADKNKALYLIVDTTLYRQEAQMWMDLKQYKLAIELFKVIGYETRIQECFKLMSQSQSNRKKQIDNRIEQAKFHASVTNFDKAIQILSQIHDQMKIEYFKDPEEFRAKQRQIKNLRQSFRKKQQRQKQITKYLQKKKDGEDQERPNQELISKLYQEWEQKNKFCGQQPSTNSMLSQEVQQIQTLNIANASKTPGNRHKKVKIEASK